MKKRIVGKKGWIVLLDDDDFEKYSSFRLCILVDKRQILNPRPRIWLDNKWQYFSRVIMNAPRKSIVDHKNGDTLDNRKTNLRFCSISENTRNSRMNSSNKSGYRGVSWDKTRKKWTALVYINNKMIHLGMFNNPKEASKKYKSFIHRNFGNYFPNIQYENK